MQDVQLLSEKYAMEPMQHHMHGGLLRAGDRWKVKQTRDSIKSKSATLAASRDWPLIVAARCDREVKALEEIKEKHEGAHCFDCVAR